MRVYKAAAEILSVAGGHHYAIGFYAWGKFNMLERSFQSKESAQAFLESMADSAELKARCMAGDRRASR